ncbi:MAG TPA: polysaccharide biosynthesis tyrosine autokinase [Candidatus Binatia bacterium]|nr:polysaccharide biosynthesis tyrosine autokinase [Candidatus Binatia bacterium]
MATPSDRLPSTHVLPGGPPAAPGEVIDAEFSEGSGRSLRDRLRVLVKYRWLAGASFAAVFGLAVAVTFLVPRKYTASTTLQVSRQSPIQLRLEDNVLKVDDSDRVVNGSSAFLSTQVQVLQSRDLAERVIRSHHLADNPAFRHPSPGAPAALAFDTADAGAFRPRGWDGAVVPPADDRWRTAPPADPKLLDQYLKWLDVKDVRGTDLVQITFTTPSPTLSAFLAAAHTQAYLAANDEAQLATHVTAKDFLGRQLKESEENLERAQRALEQFAAEHPNVAVNQEQKVVAQKIGELSTLLTTAEGERIGLETRYEFLAKPGSDPLPYFLDDEGIQKLQAALLDVRAQRAALAARLGPNHEQMVQFGRQEAELAQQLTALVQKHVTGVRQQYDAAKLREDALHRKLDELEKSAIALTELGARYDLLKGDVDTAHALHESLLQQQVQTAVNSQLAASNVRVVERAEVPLKADKPNVPLFLALGLVAGVMAGAGTAFGCEYFDRSVKSSDEVEGLLQLPTLAAIPNFRLARESSRRRAGVAAGHAADDTELVVHREPRSAVAEAFRSLRTAVLFSTPGTPPKVILVTSAGAGEGKTVVCVNLATALAEGGARVLLLDADLRRPGCHRAFAVAAEPGLSTVLTGQATAERATHALDAPRLSLMPAGPAPPNPAELVSSARMRALLDDLREVYDFIVIDSPPALPVTDAVVLAREADGVALVVKGQDTPRELVRRARDQLVLANAHVLGAVVNNVDLGWDDLYLLYSRYDGYAAAPPALEGRA